EVLPVLARPKVADVRHNDIVALHRAITDRGRPVRANRVVSVISKMFSLSLKPVAGERSRKGTRLKATMSGSRAQPRTRPRTLLLLKRVTRLERRAGQWCDARQRLFAADHADGMPTRRGNACDLHRVRRDRLLGEPSAHTKQRARHRVPLSPAAIELVGKLRGRRDGLRVSLSGARQRAATERNWSVLG